jgi:hypothetical protein
MNTKQDEGLDTITVVDKDDPLLQFVRSNESSSTSHDYSDFFDGKNELILPICGKRCYTNVINCRMEF